MKSKDIDIYVEYTGTCLVNILKKDAISDPDKVYDVVKKDFSKNFGIEVMNPLGFNNTYTIAVSQYFAKKNILSTISDLAKISSNLNAGFTMEFANRPDGYLGLQKAYNLNFKDVKGIDAGLRYTALQNNETSVLDAFATDGLLKKFNLKLLKDDKNFFPPYYAIPVVRAETLKKYPEIKDVLILLENKISDEDMRALNYKVDNGDDPRKVAEDFLKSIKLIK